ncbi:hypothetical protein ACJIZ3_002934 [Penstemon smallii]|uniref:SGTA homodimerisation domain-containing protein n=1 Tax=Penstemon smallii TaxID=265156 RepID=A0ABD3U9C0_9LAMI
MANLKTDSPLSRRIVRSFLQFLQSVEPSAGVDSEALDVAKECLADVFKIDQSSLESQSNCDSLIDIFSSREAIARNVVDNEEFSRVPPTSSGKEAEVTEGQERTREPYSLEKDELFGQFCGALEQLPYFRRLPDGKDDQKQLDRATDLFHKAVEEMQIAGCQTFDQKSLAETFKSQGNKAMQSKLYPEAVELYTFAIALLGDAVYYCNRAAAYTQMHLYADAVEDCLTSIGINPNYSKAYSRLGCAYYAQGKYRDAIDKGFTKALQLDPNNDSVKENIRAAEQKLKQEEQWARPGQSSTSTSNPHLNNRQEGGSRSNSTAAAPPPPPFPSMPFNINGVPLDITNIMNMAGNAFSGQSFANGNEQENGTGEPEIRIGGNINFNGNELPEELSGALRSMMGMFSGAPPHGNQQQDDGNGRSAAN